MSLMPLIPVFGVSVCSTLMNISKLELRWVKKLPLPNPTEDLLTRIEDQKGKLRKPTTTLIPLHSLINSPSHKKHFQKGIQKRNQVTVNECKAGTAATGNVGVLKPLTRWKSAMEPISLGNNQQKKENK